MASIEHICVGIGTGVGHQAHKAFYKRYAEINGFPYEECDAEHVCVGYGAALDPTDAVHKQVLMAYADAHSLSYEITTTPCR